MRKFLERNRLGGKALDILIPAVGISVVLGVGLYLANLFIDTYLPCFVGNCPPL